SIVGRAARRGELLRSSRRSGGIAKTSVDGVDLILTIWRSQPILCAGRNGRRIFTSPHSLAKLATDCERNAAADSTTQTRRHNLLHRHRNRCGGADFRSPRIGLLVFAPSTSLLTPASIQAGIRGMRFRKRNDVGQQSWHHGTMNRMKTAAISLALVVVLGFVKE